MADDNYVMDRGSDTLFSMAADDHEGLSKALGAARNDYEVQYWWKYGTPAINQIKGGLKVRPEAIDATLGRLLKLNNDRARINFDVFPIGVVQIDGYQVQLNLQQLGQG